jgi:GNAT superfamily N-acetyltransferase
MSNDLEFRYAAQEDVGLLAEMNQQLIRDEEHRNKMTLYELERRMSDFLQANYTTVIVRKDKDDISYALYRQDPEWIYLRQIFVKNEMRQKGVGRKIISWLKENPWKDSQRIRVEVLVGNLEGIFFWHAVGFKDYCITMEMENQQVCG